VKLNMVSNVYRARLQVNMSCALGLAQIRFCDQITWPHLEYRMYTPVRFRQIVLALQGCGEL